MSRKVPILLAAVAATAAIAFAPAAGAETTTVDCDGGTLSSVCQKTGNAAAVSAPGDRSPGDSGYWPFRADADQPVWVLD